MVSGIVNSLSTFLVYMSRWAGGLNVPWSIFWVSCVTPCSPRIGNRDVMGGVSFVSLYFLSLAVSIACSTKVLSESCSALLLYTSVTDVMGWVADSWCRHHQICLCAFFIFYFLFLTLFLCVFVDDRLRLSCHMCLFECYCSIISIYTFDISPGLSVGQLSLATFFEQTSSIKLCHQFCRAYANLFLFSWLFA